MLRQMYSLSPILGYLLVLVVVKLYKVDQLYIKIYQHPSYKTHTPSVPQSKTLKTSVYKFRHATKFSVFPKLPSRRPALAQTAPSSLSLPAPSRYPPSPSPSRYRSPSMPSPDPHRPLYPRHRPPPPPPPLSHTSHPACAASFCWSKIQFLSPAMSFWATEALDLRVPALDLRAPSMDLGDAGAGFGVASERRIWATEPLDLERHRSSIRAGC